MSVGIIGGADGPTAIFVTGQYHAAILIAALAALIVLTIWFLKRRK